MGGLARLLLEEAFKKDSDQHNPKSLLTPQKVVLTWQGKKQNVHNM